MRAVDPEDADAVAALFNLAPAMVREIVFENDEAVDAYRWVDIEVCGPMRGWNTHKRTVRMDIDPDIVASRRWHHMRAWVVNSIKGGAQHER